MKTTLEQCSLLTLTNKKHQQPKYQQLKSHHIGHVDFYRHGYLIKSKKEKEKEKEKRLS
ncbi:hypothetical protein [Vibrio splendidus]|uniref:hypothetical protein n=1 Tax=Vibrio splendidus TaxID=29497 RepID=UPI001A7E1538|nr:hypothetical protein [Vibrio splendidus]